MDVLPPELWGLITQYAPDSASDIRLVLMCREIPGKRSHKHIKRQLILGYCDGPHAWNRPFTFTRPHSAAMSSPDWETHGYTLKIQECHQAATFGSLVDILNARTDLRELGSFRNVRKIKISLCDHITDVGALAHVSAVTLSKCSRLTDISRLGGQRKVRIRDCPVADVRSLATVPDVVLRKCPVFDVSSLGLQQSLVLSDCPAITDYSTLTRVRDLRITGAHMTSLPAMANHTLVLEDCPHLADISALTRGRRASGAQSRTGPPGPPLVVELGHCPCVRNLAPLSGCRKVRIYRCAGVVDVSPLKHVRIVHIEYCANVGNIAALRDVHTLACVGIRAPPYAADRYDALPHIRCSHHSLTYHRGDGKPLSPACELQGCYQLTASDDEDDFDHAREPYVGYEWEEKHPGVRHYDVLFR